MTKFRLIGVEENSGVKVKAEVNPLVVFIIANIVEKATTKAIVLPLGKSVVNVAKTTISRLYVNPQIKEIAANIDPKQRGKRDFMK